MKLSTFIEANQEAILMEWDAFAMTLFVGDEKARRQLYRDHAREMLLELVADMDTTQSAQQGIDKSKGIVSPYHPDDTAANVHGVIRKTDGLTASGVVAEFRALRASVLRMWLPHISVMSKTTVSDMIRFNEAIDEAVADSIVTYSNA